MRQIQAPRELSEVTCDDPPKDWYEQDDQRFRWPAVKKQLPALRGEWRGELFLRNNPDERYVRFRLETIAG